MGSVAREPVSPPRIGLVVAGPGRWQWFDPYAVDPRADTGQGAPARSRAAGLSTQT